MFAATLLTSLKYYYTTFLSFPTINPFLATIMAGIVAKFYNFPIFTWGPVTPPTLSDQSRFPSLATVTVNTIR
jgi:hypothetical protein